MGRGGAASGRESGRVDQSLLSAVEREALLQLFPYHPATLGRAEEECRALVVRQSKYPERIKMQAYSNPEASVYGSLFMLDGESASPLQFMLTDSVSHFFRGALYYDCIPNADSLAPVTRYLKQDIVELIQSFEWKK
ncbi:MAG: hypothetical protein ACLR6J_12825 [Parabacteroides merdae]